MEAGLPPFIATLGMLNVARDLALIISDVRPVYFPDAPELSKASMAPSPTP